MTAPNPAVGALPGWRGTDPDGGTWVRMAIGEYHPWFHIDRHGTWQWRSQEEAEGAGLVPLYMVQLPTPLPSPLDPGNPEHLRQHADNHQRFCAALLKMPYEAAETARTVAPWDFRREADRLDRERAEAEQDAKDAHRAECIAAEVYASGAVTIGHLSEAALAGIRAGRAERQEAGQ